MDTELGRTQVPDPEVVHAGETAPVQSGVQARGGAGLCANPGEILAGPSRARETRLLAIADSLPSPHARDLVLLARRQRTEPASVFGEPSGLLTALLNRGPSAMALPLLLCGIGVRAAP